MTDHPRAVADDLVDLVVETLLDEDEWQARDLVRPSLGSYLRRPDVQRGLRDAVYGWLTAREELSAWKERR